MLVQDSSMELCDDDKLLYATIIAMDTSDISRKALMLRRLIMFRENNIVKNTFKTSSAFSKNKYAESDVSKSKLTDCGAGLFTVGSINTGIDCGA